MMEEISAVKMPNFIPSDPSLWFTMVESTFELAIPKPITASRTKFNYCVSTLPPEIAITVRDIILSPDAADPYSQLKSEIISRCGESKSQEIRTNRIRTTSYHPQSNGLVERFHRALKSSIIAHCQPNWTETIPKVLLGIRSAIKPDINATCAELVFGTTLRLASDILTSKIDLSIPTDTYVSKFKALMQSINPISTSRHSVKPIYIHASLSTCSHVFLRVDSVKPPLSPPYTGPHPVISRKDKTFVLKINNKNVTVSIDRVKPAYVLTGSNDSLPSIPASIHKTQMNFLLKMNNYRQNLS
ncbi:hypothetical protein HNY73_009472 [Argiope bruennichi]|uniref:DUF7041 domain-containing protein n=1 Tax=Argiope bruennichi TaxID=94029 RepID=A0A8T0FGC5_ARGBR|nr:hypothetical protein HNY73_009472 [Argiope bruennichi]